MRACLQRRSYGSGVRWTGGPLRAGAAMMLTLVVSTGAAGAHDPPGGSVGSAVDATARYETCGDVRDSRAGECCDDGVVPTLAGPSGGVAVVPRVDSQRAVGPTDMLRATAEALSATVDAVGIPLGATRRAVATTVGALGRALGSRTGIEVDSWHAALPWALAAESGATDAREQRQRRRRERRNREIERTIEVLELAPGDTVAEIGAGDGRFSLRFATVVGPEGKVYANELSSRSVERIRERAEEAGLDNLEVVQGAVDDTNLPDGCCDAMMMRMVYHMLTDPGPMSRSFHRALRPGGRLVILEGDPEPGEDAADGVPANRQGMGIEPQIVIDELAEVGFELDRHIADWPGADYALVFHKPGADGAPEFHEPGASTPDGGR